MILLKKAFIYARISTRQQLEGDGFPRQIETCNKFAAQAGFCIARTFTEQQTGSDEFQDRKKLSEAMDLAGKHSPYNVTAIIVERSDRIARDLIVSELFFRECRKAGIEVWAADSGEELVNAAADPTRILIRQILGALGQWEKAMLMRKLLSGRRKKKLETGKPCGGMPKYSDPDIIADIIRMRLNKGMEFKEIARALTRRGVPTHKGKNGKWHPSVVWYIYRDHRPEGPEMLRSQLAAEMEG